MSEGLYRILLIGMLMGSPKEDKDAAEYETGLFSCAANRKSPR